MSLDRLHESECTVSGLLCVVLHMSRIAGSAPLKFKRVYGGWQISSSRIGVLYCYVVATFICGWTYIFVYAADDDVVDGYDPASNTGFMSVIQRVYHALQILTLYTMAYNSNYRMSNMIDCLSQLKQINQMLDKLFEQTPITEKKSWLLVIITITLAYSAALLEYGTYMLDVVRENDRVPIASYAFGVVFFGQLLLATLPIQFGIIVMRLVATQKRLKNYLKILLQEIQNDCYCSNRLFTLTKRYTNSNEFNVKNRTSLSNSIFNQQSTSFEVKTGYSKNSEVIKQMSEIYCSLCGILRKLNDSNGASIIVLLLYVLTFMVTVPKFYVAVLFQHETKLATSKTISLVLFSGYCISMVVMASEPCHNSHYQILSAVVTYLSVVMNL